jgi:hypothetical protein
MKLATITLASAFAISSTAAFAQADGAGSGAQVHRKHHAAKSSRAKHRARPIGSSMGSGRSSGDAITTGSGAPQNNPNLSRSPETSDTGRKVP